MRRYLLKNQTFLQGDDDSNSSSGNNTTPTLHIIEFCTFDNDTLDYFKNQFDNIKNMKQIQVLDIITTSNIVLVMKLAVDKLYHTIPNEAQSSVYRC